jgi:hypothetical protein
MAQSKVRCDNHRVPRLRAALDGATRKTRKCHPLHRPPTPYAFLGPCIQKQTWNRYVSKFTTRCPGLDILIKRSLMDESDSF